MCVCDVAVPGGCRARLTCRQLLESVTCYDVMPRKTCVVVIDSELPVSDVHCHSGLLVVSSVQYEYSLFENTFFYIFTSKNMWLSSFYIFRSDIWKNVKKA